MNGLLRYLIFFPSITFRLLSAEIFPWAIIYSLKNLTIQKRAIPFFVVILISVSYSLYVILFQHQEGDILRSLVAFINPLLVYMSILKCSDMELYRFQKMVKYVFIFMIIWGGLQYVGVLGFLEPVQNFLIARGGIESLGLGRGVSILSSEPSRAAYELLFIFVCFRTISNLDKKTQLFMDLFISLYLLFIIKSAVGFAMLLLFLISVYRLKLILFIAIGWAIIGISTFQNIENNRTISVLTSLLTSSDTFTVLISMSGFRLISLISSYKYAVFHPLGGGIGIWESSSLTAMEQSGINPADLYYFSSNGGHFTSVRPESYLAGVALDMGVVGIIATIVFIKPLFKYLIKINHPLFPISVLFLYYLVFSGSIGNPIPWVCMAISCRFIKLKEDGISNNSVL